eukprot:5286490-Pyramimonas_sp.AAC.2
MRQISYNNSHTGITTNRETSSAARDSERVSPRLRHDNRSFSTSTLKKVCRAERIWNSHNPASPTSRRRNELIMPWPFSAPARRTLHDAMASCHL